MKSFTARVGERVRHELSLLRHQGPVLPFFAALLWLGLASRVDLYRFSYLPIAPPFGALLSRRRVWHYLGQELVFAALVALPVWLVWRAHRACKVPTASQRRSGWLTLLGLAVVLSLLGFIYGTQSHLVHTLNTPISAALLLEANGTFPLAEFVEQLTWVDHAYLWLPPAIFLALVYLPPSARRVREVPLSLSVVVCIAATFGLAPPKKIATRSKAILVNPVVYGMRQLHQAITNPPPSYFQGKNLWGPEQEQSLRLSDALFGAQSPVALHDTCALSGANKRYNILWVIMESLAATHAFNSERTGVQPMPTLRALRDQGLFLANHVSTNNSSPHSIFSMFSGLYPMPRPGTFSTTSDLRIPSLFSRLGKSYDSFLVSPGSLMWYFPYDFLKNTGVAELWGRENLKEFRHRPTDDNSVDERDAVDFFLERLKRARPPFAAVYYSFAPHHPYVLPKDVPKITRDDEPIDRYYDGMHFLDSELSRIVSAVYQQFKPEDTIIVLTGDHGEAFEEHAGNMKHANGSYLETIHTPAIILHPQLFPASIEQRFTSHVDFIPTLLDAMCIPFDAAELQGQSLFKRDFQRDYLFVYGSENAVTSISAAGSKVSANFGNGSTQRFELSNDPHELQPLPVPADLPQLRANLQFQRFQSKMLFRYKQRALHGG